MADLKVTTSSRLWSEEVARAAAGDTLDRATAGGNVLVDQAKPVIYEFAGGRNTFVQPDNIYG